MKCPQIVIIVSHLKSIWRLKISCIHSYKEKQNKAIIFRLVLPLFVFNTTNLNLVALFRFNVMIYLFSEQLQRKIFCWHVARQYCFHYSHFATDYTFLLWEQRNMFLKGISEFQSDWEFFIQSFQRRDGRFRPWKYAKGTEISRYTI